MIEEKSKKKNKVIKGIALLGLFLMVVGISYALFKVTLNGNKINKIKTGKFSLKLTDKNGVEEKDLPDGVMGINLTKAVPMSAKEAIENNEPYEFNLVNDGDYPVNYTMYIEVDNSSTLDDNKIKYNLTRTDTKETLSDNYDVRALTDVQEEPIIEGATNIWAFQSRLLSLLEKKSNSYKIDMGIIGPGQTQKYSLKMWISYASGTEVNEKTFEGKIKVEGLQTKKDAGYPIETYDVTDEDTLLLELHNTFATLYSDNSLHFHGIGAASLFKNDKLIYSLMSLKMNDENFAKINSVLEKYNIDPINDRTKIAELVYKIDSDDFEYDSTYTEEFCEEFMSTLEEIDFFNETITLNNLYFDDGILEIESEGFNNEIFNFENIYISRTINSIGYRTFENSNINKVEFMSTKDKFYDNYLQNELKIGSSAFSETSLREMTVPNYITEINYGAFANNNNLNLKIDANENDVLVSANAFDNIASITWLR